MKRSLATLFAVLALAAFGAAGCAHFSRQSSHASARQPHTFALAVTVNGVLQPTPAQWAVIQAKLADVLAQQGAVLVTDLALAERILRIDFTPDPLDPENSGHAVLLGVRTNPRYGYASTSFGSFPTSFGYQGTFQSALWSHGYGYGYGYAGYSPYGYGWNDSYYDGYSYGSGNLSPIAPPVPTKPTLPPQRTHPHDRPACPPPSDTYVRTLPTRFPGEYALNQPADHRRSAPGEHRHWRGGDDTSSPPTAASSYARGYTSWRGDRTAAASEGSAARSERGYARSDSSGARSERSYARSESSGSRSERGNWRSERTYSRSDSSPSYSRSDSSSSYSRSESSSYSPSYSSSSSSYSSSDSSSSSSSYSGGSSASISGSGGGSSGQSTAVEPTSTRNQN